MIVRTLFLSFVCLFLGINTHAMYKQVTRRPDRSHAQPRSYSSSSTRPYDILTLNTRIYDPSHKLSRSTAIVQQHFQKEFERMGRELRQEICDHLKITPQELQSNACKVQWIIERQTSEPYALLGQNQRLMVEAVLASLDPEFKNTMIVSAQNIAFGEKNNSTYGFSGHNLIGIHPLIISPDMGQVYKHIVGHEAGHVKGLDEIFSATLRAYPKMDKYFLDSFDRFCEIRAECYAHTRGPQWLGYALNNASFLYPDGDLSTAANEMHGTMSERTTFAQYVDNMFKNLAKN